MNFSSRSTQAIAASIVALVIVAPVAFQELSKSAFNQTFRELQGDPRAGAAGQSADYAAPQSGADVAVAKQPELAPVPSPAATPPAPPVAATAPANISSATPAEPPRDAVARQEKSKVAAVSANDPTPAAKSPEPADARSRDDGAKVATERSAATDRKKLDELAQVPAAATPAPAPALPGAGGVRQKELAKGEATGGEAASRGQLSAGKQSLGADNAAIGTDFSSTPAPQNGVTFDGGTTRVAPPSTAAAPAAPDASIAALDDASLARSVAPPAKPRLDAATGRRILESDKYATQADLRPAVPHDPYDWMGHGDEQKAVALEESRDKFDAPPSQPGQAGRGRTRLDLLARCRYRVVCVRAPRAQCRPSAAEGCRARRGDDQLFPLRLSGARDGRDAVQAVGHGGRRHLGTRATNSCTSRSRATI